MEVRTAVGADGLLTIDVLGEGGSEQIRNRCSGRRSSASGVCSPNAVRRRNGDETDNYECSTPVPDASGLLRIPSGRTEGGENLVVGHMFLQPSTGDVVRVAGRLAKNPSFWVSHVDVEWSYAASSTTSFAGVALVDSQGEDVRRLHVPHDLRLSERGWSASRQRSRGEPITCRLRRVTVTGRTRRARRPGLGRPVHQSRTSPRRSR